MVRLTKVVSKDDLNHKIVAELTCDALTDITDDMEVEGLPDGYTLDFGSVACSTSFEVAMMKSDGTWQK